MEESEEKENSMIDEDMYSHQNYNSRRRIPLDKKVAITHIGSKSTVIRLGEKSIEIPDHHYVIKLTEDTTNLNRKIREQEIKIQRLTNTINKLSEEINNIKSDLVNKFDRDE